MRDQDRRALLERLEREALERPARHRWRIRLYSSIALLWPLLLFGFPLALMALEIWAIYKFGLGNALIVASTALTLAMLAFFAKKLQIFDGKVAPPPFPSIAPAEIPELAATIDSVKTRMGLRRELTLHLTPNVNAGAYDKSVSIAPLFLTIGGGSRKAGMLIGVPMLMFLTPDELNSVITHELGHLYSRHCHFGARVIRLLESLAHYCGELRWHFFLHHYYSFFAWRTLPMRRIFEYQADAMAAGMSSPEATARALVKIDRLVHVMQVRVLGAIFSQCAERAMPPDDYLALIDELIREPQNPGEFAEWKQSRLEAGTQIDDEHPCLADRLAALGRLDILANLTSDEMNRMLEPQSASRHLLGSNSEALLKRVNQTWKIQIMEDWRRSRGYYEYLRSKLRDMEDPSQPAAEEKEDDAEWLMLDFQLQGLRYHEKIERIEEFLLGKPDHADAWFRLGFVQLGTGNPAGAQSIDLAIKLKPEMTKMGLERLQSFHRERSEDAAADAVAERLQEFQRRHADAENELRRLARDDIFTEHDLTAFKVRALTNLLNHFSIIKTAWLARKEIDHLEGLKHYVLLIEFHPLGLGESGQRIKSSLQYLKDEISLSVGVFNAAHVPAGVRNRIQGIAGDPIYRG